MTPHEQLEKARATLADLEGQDARLGDRLAENEAERQRIAHAALTGDGAARERLLALKAEAASVDDDRKDVASAVAQARQDVQAAEAAVARAAEVDQAKRRLALAERLRAAGIAADEAGRSLVHFIAEVDAISRDPDAVSLGFVNPRVHADVALHTLLQPIQGFLPAKDRRAVAPSERRTFGAVLGAWADRITADAQRVIKSQPKTRRAA